jgi:hypothetical protein
MLPPDVVYFYCCVFTCVLGVVGSFSWVWWNIQHSLHEVSKIEQRQIVRARIRRARKKMISGSQHRVSFSDDGSAQHLSRDDCLQLNDADGCVPKHMSDAKHVSAQLPRRQVPLYEKASRPSVTRESSDRYVAGLSKDRHDPRPCPMEYGNQSTGISSLSTSSPSADDVMLHKQLVEQLVLLEQLVILDKRLDGFATPSRHDDAFSESFNILCISASFSELANRTCQHLKISKVDLWSNKPLWNSLKQTWAAFESKKPSAAEDSKENEHTHLLPKVPRPEHTANTWDSIVSHKEHQVCCIMIESDSRTSSDSTIDGEACNLVAGEDLRSAKAQVTGHLLSRLSGSHPAAVITCHR